MWRRAIRITCALGLVALPLWSQSEWSPVPRSLAPVPVSPGGGPAEKLIAEACPTFHWAEAAEAEGYELIVHRVEGKDATRLGAIQELGEDPGAPALRQLLPAGVGSWTPSVDRCLEPGSHYAWTVRVTEEGFPDPAAWAEAQHFVVREQSRLEQILGRVVNRLLEEGQLSEEDAEQLAAWGLGGGEPALAAEVANEAVVPASGSPAQSGLQVLTAAGGGSSTVAFNVDATGFDIGAYVEAASYAGVVGVGPIGVYGIDNQNVPGSGVIGETFFGTGVYGRGIAVSGTNYGVRGVSNSTSGTAVSGEAKAASGTTYGVHGVSSSTSGRGVRGWATATSGTNYGVVGNTKSNSGYDFYASGAGTNYGPFTGGHEARLAEGVGEVVPGMVVSVTGRAEVRKEDEAVNLSSTLPTVALSCRAADPAVFGVLVAESELSEDHWYLAAEGERFATVNALGEGRVWVTDANGPVSAGDYLTTSHVPGYAQRQGDRYLQSHTLGKAIETVDWETVTETVEHGGVTYKKALLAVVYTSG